MFPPINHLFFLISPHHTTYPYGGLVIVGARNHKCQVGVTLYPDHFPKHQNDDHQIISHHDRRLAGELLLPILPLLFCRALFRVPQIYRMGGFFSLQIYSRTAHC
jgi:hypothetical protein